MIETINYLRKRGFTLEEAAAVIAGESNLHVEQVMSIYYQEKRMDPGHTTVLAPKSDIVDEVITNKHETERSL